MWLHFSIIAFILLVSALGNGKFKQDKLFDISIFAVLFLISALRGTSVGNDTGEYLRIFHLVSKQNSLSSALSVSRYEPGYIIYNYVLAKFTSNFQWLLAINAAVYLTAVLFFIRRYAINKGKAIILFFSFGLYYNVMNLQRQCIATAIFLFAIPLLERKKYIKYAVMILAAASFHSMILILISLIFIPKIDFSKKIEMLKWTFISTIFLVTLNYGITFILQYFPYLSHYITNSAYSVGGIRSASIAICLIRFLSVGVIIVVKGSFTSDSEYIRSDFFNKMVLLDCVISVASIGFNMYDRIEKYVCIGFVVAISNALENMSISNKWISYGLIFIASFAYLTATLIYRPEWSGIFPYALFK